MIRNLADERERLSVQETIRQLIAERKSSRFFAGPRIFAHSIVFIFLLFIPFSMRLFLILFAKFQLRHCTCFSVNLYYIGNFYTFFAFLKCTLEI